MCSRGLAHAFEGGRKSIQVAGYWHTPSRISFRHLPPDSARTGYATDRALYIAHRSCPPTLSAPSERFGTVLIRLWKQHSVKERHVNTRGASAPTSAPGKNEKDKRICVNTRRVRPGLKKEKEKSCVSIQTSLALFVLAVTHVQRGRLQKIPLINRI